MLNHLKVLLLPLFVASLYTQPLFAVSVDANKNKKSDVTTGTQLPIRVIPRRYRSVVSNWENFTTPLISGEGHETHRGSAWCDYDNDGFIDLYVSHFGAFDPDGVYEGSPNQLLRNIGDGIFIDATTQALEAYSGLSHHPAWADIDNDLKPDLFVSQSSPTQSVHSVLFHNDGEGEFSDITNGEPFAMAGMLPRGIGWQDMNNDGLVDLLVAVSGGDEQKNRMFVNNGNAAFSLSGSLFADEDKESRSIGWCDYNNDNLPDVYIANGAEDHTDVSVRTNQLYKNLGGGEWIDVAAESGVDDIGHGRGCVWGDINNDGNLDLLVGNQKGSDTGGGFNKLYKNNGDGTFTDITVSAGLYADFRTRCVSMADYDNDGFIDLYLVNFGGAAPPNHLFKNDGNSHFVEVGVGSLAQGNLQNGASASWADFDNDGWMDLFLVGGSSQAPGNGFNKLLRNANQNGNHWIEIELCGVLSNASAIGARVSITHLDEEGELVSQMREIQSGTGYNSGNMLRAHFGVGTSEVIDTVTIRWPSGILQSTVNLEVDKIIRVVEDTVFALDCNRNCIADMVDIFGGSSLDVNGNGIPDECECLANLDGDNDVDVTDLLILITNFGSTGSLIGDLDGDQDVDITDLIALIAAWGDC